MGRRPWAKNEIGFHKSKTNNLLIDSFQALSLAPKNRIFVPRCGKTGDIAWRLSKGHRVVGVELSKLAVEQLFSDLGVEPNISTVGKLLNVNAANIDIFVGDVFNLSAEIIGMVDANNVSKG